MVSTLLRFHCGFLKDTLRVQPEILVLIIKFFSLHFTIIEIEGERGSSSQNERILRGERGGGRGEGVQKSRILSERTFCMSPIKDYISTFDQKYKKIGKLNMKLPLKILALNY